MLERLAVSITSGIGSAFESMFPEQLAGVEQVGHRMPPQSCIIWQNKGNAAAMSRCTEI